MAKIYTSKTDDTYVALSNVEKRHIYKIGAAVIRDVAERTQNGNLPARWNDNDINALEIPLLCEPLEIGGKFIDLQTTQIHKYDKALNKLYGCNFQELFEIEIEIGELTKEEVFQRMEDYRALKKKVALDKIKEAKQDLISQSGLFY